MDEIKLENDLRLCDVKGENLRKAMEKVQSQANDMVLFTLHWTDLEKYLKKAKESVEESVRDVKLKETELQEKSFELEERVKIVEVRESNVSELEVKADGFRLEIEEQEKELGFIKNQVEVCQGELKEEEVRLSEVRKSVEECVVEYRSKRSQVDELVELLRKTQVDVDVNGVKLGKMETDLERCRVEVIAEMDHLDRNRSRRKELDEEIERRMKDLSSVLDRIVECEKKFETRSRELRKTQGEVESKGKQLEQMSLDIERRRVEVTAEEEHLRMTRDQRRELEEEIDRKRKELKGVDGKFAEHLKQLEMVAKQLDSHQKLLETQSSELVSKEKELQAIREKTRCSILDHDLREQIMKDTCQQTDTKAMELVNIERSIEERKEHYESIKSLIEEHDEELASKEKRQNEMTETIHKLSLEVVSKEKTLERANCFIEQLSEKQHSIEKKLESTERRLEKSTTKLDSKKQELCSVKDELRECLQDVDTKKDELKSVESVISERNKKFEEVAKKMQRLEKSNKELLRQLQGKKEELCSINNSIKECSSELQSKLKQRDQYQSSITGLIAEIKLKESDLNSVKKKIQDSLKDFQSKEEERVRLKASLVEREKELGRKEKKCDVCWEKMKQKKKELDTQEENIDKKKKELDTQEENIGKKAELLKSTEEKLAKCFKDTEVNAKKLSSFCQQSKPSKLGNLVRDANVSDEKTLQLLLQGLLKKCPQLYLEVSRALEPSSDPAKLVLDTIQRLFSAGQRMAISNRDLNAVRRSIICLLDCLMDMSPKPTAEVKEEAIKFAIEWKTTTLLTAENPVEVLGFLHFLATFSLAYDFDADKVHNLFDDAFLRKYSQSLCEALGILALAPVTDEQQPPEAPINNSSDPRSRDVQEKATVSQLADEDVLRDHDVSFSPNQVATELLLFDDPCTFVLNSVKDQLTGSNQRGELGLAEPIVKTLITLLEELARVVSSIDPDLKLDAIKVAKQWSMKIVNTSYVSPLEALSFLQFIVSFQLVDHIDKDKTLRFAAYVAHFKQAPRLFQSLGLSYAIEDVVKQLLTKHQCIQAIRFMLYFNVNSRLSTPEYLKEQIINLRRSVKENIGLEPQIEDRDAGILTDIIELIQDFKLDIDLPVDLIAKFMVLRETQNQNHYVVSPSVPFEPLQLSPQVHMQASHTVIHSSFIATATHGLNQTLPTRLGLSPNQQIVDVETYQASGSAVFQSQSSDRAGLKRPRVDSQGSRSTIRRCINPSDRESFSRLG